MCISVYIIIIIYDIYDPLTAVRSSPHIVP